MEKTQTTMINISKYLTSIFTKASLETFKEFLPENFEAQVVWNNLGTSDLTTPIAMKIYNMCNRKPNWKYSTSQEVAEELIKNIKDEKEIISETKITIQSPPQSISRFFISKYSKRNAYRSLTFNNNRR